MMNINKDILQKYNGIYPAKNISEIDEIVNKISSENNIKQSDIKNILSNRQLDTLDVEHFSKSKKRSRANISTNSSNKYQRN